MTSPTQKPGGPNPELFALLILLGRLWSHRILLIDTVKIPCQGL